MNTILSTWYFESFNINMTAPYDCPICMDEVDFIKNCVTTECGHTFHASCLMTSVAHNGFACPYCRTAMAEEVAEEEEEWEDDATVEEIYGDDALRGFRFFMNNVNGLRHDAEDVEEEESVIEAEMGPRRRTYGDVRFNDNGEMSWEEEEDEEQKPTAEFVAQTLTEQGVTVEQLVKALMADHEEYQDDDDIERINDELFGKLRIIISNYKPGDQAKNRPEIDDPQLALPQPIIVDV
jgi:hypothetical protein